MIVFRFLFLPLAQKTTGPTVEKWRFAESDYSSVRNDFGGFYNASSHPNVGAFVFTLSGIIIVTCI
jgi:hypothetical protein